MRLRKVKKSQVNVNASAMMTMNISQMDLCFKSFLTYSLIAGLAMYMQLKTSTIQMFMMSTAPREYNKVPPA